MPDMFLDIANADTEMVSMIGERLERRAAAPVQQAMLADYLSRIEFPPQARVLEVGSGTGPVCRTIAGLSNVGEVIGVDPSPEFVRLANEHAASMDNVSFQTAGGTELSFEDSSFDVVVMHTLLTHVADQQQMLDEARRVLRPDGWLAVFDADFATESVAITGNDPLEVCIEAHREFFVHDPYFVRRMSAVLTQAGFDAGPVVSYGQVDSANEVGSTGWVDMGANALAADGRITEAMAGAYSQEAQHRLESGTWFSYLAFASLIARPAR